MMMVRRTLLAWVAMLLAASASGVPAQSMTPDQRVALDSAERWLVPLDAGRYADAWAMASAPLKTTVSRQEWQDGLRKIRKDYGRVVARKAGKIAYVGVAPGPDYPTTGPTEGMQVGILFDTKFAGNKAATEEVTLVFEKDGLWRVAGYYIR